MVNQNGTGCSTFYTGIPSNLINCLNICLVDLKKENIQQLTVSTLKDSFDVIKEKTFLSREDTEDPFILKIEDTDIDEFDTIIYLTKSGYPVGYTKFETKQILSKEISNSETVRISNQLKINISFTSKVGDVYEADVFISNDLSGLDSDEATTDKKFFLDEDYNYTNKEKLDDTIKNLDKYVRYTNDISSIIDSPSFGLVTDTVFLNDKTVYKSSINNNTSLFSYFTNFNNWSIGNWKGNILLYRWNDENKFLVSSLTEYNRFGKATEYFNSNLKKVQELPQEYKIEYMTGKYAVLTDSEGKSCFQDLEDLSSPVEYSGDYGFFIDTYDSESNVRFFDTSKRLIDSITNINIKKDLYSFCQVAYTDSSLNKNWSLYKKIGPWYVLRKNSDPESLMWINENGTLYSSTFENILVVSSRCLLLSKENNWFLFFFEDGTIMETAGYSYIKDNKRGVFEVGQRYVDSKLVCQYDKFEKDGSLVNLTSARNQIVDGLRHSYLRNFNLPEIKISYMGYLFYEDTQENSNILKYL